MNTAEQADEILSFDRELAALKDVCPSDALAFCMERIPGPGEVNGRTVALDDRVDGQGRPCGFYCVYYGVRAAVYIE